MAKCRLETEWRARPTDFICLGRKGGIEALRLQKGGWLSEETSLSRIPATRYLPTCLITLSAAFMQPECRWFLHPLHFQQCPWGPFFYHLLSFCLWGFKVLHYKSKTLWTLLPLFVSSQFLPLSSFPDSMSTFADALLTQPAPSLPYTLTSVSPAIWKVFFFPETLSCTYLFPIPFISF